MKYQVKVNTQENKRKKYLFQIYLALGCSIAASLSYFFYKDLTFVLLVFNTLNILALLRDKIFESVEK